MTETQRVPLFPLGVVLLPEISLPLQLSFAIAALEGFTVAERQRFLETASTSERIKKGVQALSRLVRRHILADQSSDSSVQAA